MNFTTFTVRLSKPEEILTTGNGCTLIPRSSHFCTKTKGVRITIHQKIELKKFQSVVLHQTCMGIFHSWQCIHAALHLLPFPGQYFFSRFGNQSFISAAQKIDGGGARAHNGIVLSQMPFLKICDSDSLVFQAKMGGAGLECTVGTRYCWLQVSHNKQFFSTKIVHQRFKLHLLQEPFTR